MNPVCRGIRGATTVTENTKDAILSSTRELLEELVEKNDIQLDQIAAAIFTTTRDINAEFPRSLGTPTNGLDRCGSFM